MSPLDARVFSATAGASLLFTLAAFLGRGRFAILDVPNERSSHAVAKPRTGGVPLMVAVLLGYLAHRFGAGSWPARDLAIFVSALFFFLLGLADDKWRLPEKTRLAAQVCAAGALALAGVRLEVLHLPWAGVWAPPMPVSFGLTIFWICGFVNLFNFMDGVDGLAASHAAIAGLFLYAMTGEAWPLLASAAALGFLPLNREPARLFMGDGGSYLLGFLLAVSCLPASRGAAAAPFPALILVLGAFIADTTATLVRRIVNGEDWMRAHRSHYYQKLTDRGWSHAKVASLYAGMTFVLGCASLSFAAAREPTPMEFPVGFFSVDTPAQARTLHEKGFNAFQCYKTSPEEVSPVALEARRLGAMLLVSPTALFTSTHAAAEFPGAVWYLQDEPDVNGMDREALRAVETKTLAWAPGSKTAFVVGDGNKAKNYPGVADAIMVDWYPVPHRPLESAGDQVRTTAQAAGGRKVWAVLQAMDWIEFSTPQTNKRRIGRFPTKAELRFMSYDSVLNGANGVWYFAYGRPAGLTLSDSPELLARVEAAAAEIRALAAVFSRGRPIPLPFEPPTKGWMSRAWTYRGRDYLILANRTGDRQWKVPDEALEPAWRPLFESRRNPRELLKEFGGAYYLRPYQVLVLESRLRPRPSPRR